MKIKASDGKIINVGEKDATQTLQEQVDDLIAIVLSQQVKIEELNEQVSGGA